LKTVTWTNFRLPAWVTVFIFLGFCIWSPRSEPVLTVTGKASLGCPLTMVWAQSPWRDFLALSSFFFQILEHVFLFYHHWHIEPQALSPQRTPSLRDDRDDFHNTGLRQHKRIQASDSDTHAKKSYDSVTRKTNRYGDPPESAGGVLAILLRSFMDHLDMRQFVSRTPCC